MSCNQAGSFAPSITVSRASGPITLYFRTKIARVRRYATFGTGWFQRSPSSAVNTYSEAAPCGSQVSQPHGVLIAVARSLNDRDKAYRVQRHTQLSYERQSLQLAANHQSWLHLVLRPRYLSTP